MRSRALSRGVERARVEADRPDIGMVELLRTVGDELDATCGVSRGQLRALAVLPRSIVAIFGALSPGEPNTMVSFDCAGLARLAAAARAARGASIQRRVTLDISPAGYADLLRAVGELARENGWAGLRLLPFDRGLVLYHDGGHELALGERRARELVNGAFLRRTDATAATEDMSLRRRPGLRLLETREVAARPYTYAAALGALGRRLTDEGWAHPLIAEVADGFALIGAGPDGPQQAEVVPAASLEAVGARRRRGGRRPSATPVLEEGLREVGAYLDRAHAREALIQRRPATAQAPDGAFALSFTALSGPGGVMGSFERRVIPLFTPGMTDLDIAEL